MTLSPTEVTKDATDTRKRKIDALLESLDASKYLPPSPTKQSTYAPWDRTALSTRLLTFRRYPIHSIQSPINAYSLARQGWQFVGEKTISCVHCHARFVVLITTKSLSARKALETRYADLIEASHINRCLWSNRTCEEKLLRIPLADLKMSLQAMQSRVDTFAACSDAEHGTLESFEVDDTVKEANMSIFEQLALYGWQCDKQESVNLLSCRDCHRRISLARTDKLNMDHYEYCPWVCVTTQGTQAGWSMLLMHYMKSKRASKGDDVRAAARIAAIVEEQGYYAVVRNIREKLGFTGNAQLRQVSKNGHRMITDGLLHSLKRKEA